MKIQILSDLHLEFDYRDYNFTKCDLLILAGDIHTGTKGLEWIQQQVSDIPVIYVMGNHEYYGYCYPSLLNKCRGIAKGSNIHLLENDSITIQNITFHGATLWTDFNLFGNPEIAQFECDRNMNDSRLIRLDENYAKFKAAITKEIHIQSIKWLAKSLNNSKTDKNIIVTHHAPTFKSIAPRYKESPITPGFTSNLENIIHNYNPDLWVHGHVHDVVDCVVGKTRVLCNPNGYPHEIDNGFKEQLIIDI
ncbi:phosphoesterase [Thiospirochaeta perfilievii]|uniref:Phosphoesterase n=1 Tax=Thiospirochaeta perfilievii TaxID=252967 RepID=A0A5C1Q7S1_9SPIO|nr:metallophosphoesterase [Thiospirochaeta perfilievii]QEN03358.1 phosphoesterase [Thiospirochaeta perfilievii]